MVQHMPNKRVSFIDAVVLAVSQLGGVLRPVDLEDIAMKADTILPGRFRWKKYRDQVNLYAIRYAVKDAQGEQLLRGRAKTGWQLTPAGLARAEELSATMGERRVEQLSPEVARQREIERVRLVKLSAYDKWSRNESCVETEARAVFRVDDYADAEALRRAIDRVVILFQGDELNDFVEATAQALLGPSEEEPDADRC